MINIAHELPYDEIVIDIATGMVTFKFKGAMMFYNQLTHALREGDTLTLSGIKGCIEIRTSEL